MAKSDQLKAAALAAGGHDWQWWDSCSFRRLTFKEGQHTRDGSALSAVVQQSDGHPDVLMAAGVREFIELASPAGVLALLQDRDRLRDALIAVDTRLHASIGFSLSAEDAYDSFFQGVVADALIQQEQDR